MNPKIQVFIEEYLQEIDKNLFGVLYDILYEDDTYDGYDISDFTHALYEADIDPLEYITGVPGGFMFGRKDITEIDLRNGLKAIGVGAYYGCENLRKIYLPQSLVRIQEQAFLGCNEIEDLTIMNPLIIMDDEAFTTMKSIDVIHFNGTKEDYEDADFPFVGKHIYCIDGELENV